MGEPFSKFKLRFYFFVGAIICHFTALLIPAFDSSHLIQLNIVPGFQDLRALPSDLGRGTLVSEKTENIFRSSPELVPLPGLRWDALHYLDVAMYGTYAYEHQYAFSPGVPIVLRLVRSGKELLFRLTLHTPSLGSVNSQLGAWIDNIINTFLVAMLAAQPCLVLYRLTEKITHSKDFSYLTLIMHMLMGAPPVIIRSAYAEPFFAWFTFEGLSSYHDRRYLAASLYFGLATAFRTNGILLPCFILYDLLVHPVLLELFVGFSHFPKLRLADVAAHTYRASKKLSLFRLIYGVLLTIISLLPFIAQQYLAYLTFCHSSTPRPWCISRIPLIYSFVQSHYWDVGLWRYWTIAQIPNFLLAMPILALAFSSVVWFIISSSRGVRVAREKNNSPFPELAFTPLKTLTLLPYALHALALSVILLAAAHVQIALRVLPAATPWVSWAGAALIVQGARQKRDSKKKLSSGAASPNRSWWSLLSNLWIGWSVIWLLVSSVLWLAFLPPA